MRLLSSSARYRFNHNLHRISFGVRGYVDSLDGVFQREAMGDEPGEIEAVAVTTEDEIGDFIGDVECDE